LIYRLSTISVAETGGARQNRARRRRGDAVARGVAREKETRVSEGKRRPVGPTEPLVGLDQYAGADRWAWPDRWARVGREREVRGRVFNRI
jgi:hypothetical protein